MKNMMTMMMAIVAAIVMTAGFAQTAQAQQTVTVLTTSTSSVSGTTDATVTSDAFWVKAGAGFAVIPSFNVTGTTGTSNVTFRFAVSTDGTTWTTTKPCTYTVAATGTTAVIGYANFGPRPYATNNVTGLDNIRYARLASIYNENAAAITINSIKISRNK